MILVVSSLPILMLTFIYGSISSGDLMILLVSYVVGRCTAWKSRNLRVLPHEAVHILQCDHLRDHVSCCRWNIHAECVPLKISGDRDQHDGAQFRGDDPEGELWSVGIPSSPESGNHVRGALENQVAGGGGNFTITHLLGDNGGNFITNHWVFCSLVIQAVLSVLFTWGAVFSQSRRDRKTGSFGKPTGTGRRS